MLFRELDVGCVFELEDQGKWPEWMRGALAKVHRRKNTYNENLWANASSLEQKLIHKLDKPYKEVYVCSNTPVKFISDNAWRFKCQSQQKYMSALPSTMSQLAITK